MIPLDVINTREGSNIDMYEFWQIIYMSSLFMSVVVMPFAYFFYETDEDLDYVSQLNISNLFNNRNLDSVLHLGMN